MAKKKQNTVEELERELSPEGVRLAKTFVKRQNEWLRVHAEVTQHPERNAINAFLLAYYFDRED